MVINICVCCTYERGKDLDSYVQVSCGTVGTEGRFKCVRYGRRLRRGWFWVWRLLNIGCLKSLDTRTEVVVDIVGQVSPISVELVTTC